MSDWVGPYRVRSELGRGGSGVVFQAERADTGEPVAVKVLLRGSRPGGERARFLREVEVGRRLRHPNLTRVLDAGEDRGRAYLVQEFVVGASLEEALRRGSVPLERGLGIARQIAEGLAHLHAHGVLHRDLKPGNVLLGQDGSVKLTDFGLAKVQLDGQSLTQSGHLLGTPAYMAPEQIDDAKRVDARADVYAWAATVFHTLTGALPFDQPSSIELLVAIASTPPPSATRLNPQVRREIDALLRTCMAKDPLQRPANGAALLRAFDRACRVPTVSTVDPSPTAQPTPPTPSSSSPLLSVLGVLLLLAVGAGWGWSLMPTGAPEGPPEPVAPAEIAQPAAPAQPPAPPSKPPGWDTPVATWEARATQAVDAQDLDAARLLAEQAPHVGWVWTALAIVSANAGDMEGALLAVERARSAEVPQREGNLDALELQILLALDRKLEAYPLSKALRKRGSVRDQIDHGFLARSVGELEDARETLGAVLERGSDSWQLWFQYAGVLYGLGELERAVEAYAQADRVVQGRNPFPKLRQGEVLIHLGRLTSAEAVLSELRGFDAVAEEVLQLRARIAVKEDQPQTALDLLQTQTGASKPWQVAELRIRAWTALGERARAQAIYDEARARWPDDLGLVEAGALLGD